ncbi:hypothetical protein BKA82DRAFT_4085759 [Pisolithus tinctorius]|nr:hypothetical protein BKA82DRAFT_4085759 [Pisolithus tinctorius]
MSRATSLSCFLVLAHVLLLNGAHWHADILARRRFQVLLIWGVQQRQFQLRNEFKAPHAPTSRGSNYLAVR